MKRPAWFLVMLLCAANLIIKAQTPSFVWVREGEAVFGRGVKIVTDSAGNNYVAASFTGSSLTLGSTVLTGINNGEPNLYVAKYDANGNLLWVRQTNNCYLNQPSSIALDAVNGKIYVTGRYCTTSTLGTGTFGSFNFTDGFNSLFLAQLDAATGNVLWLKCTNVGSVQNVNEGFGNSVVTSGNYIYLAGEFINTVIFGTDTLTSIGYGDAFLAKYDNDGNWLWIRTAGYFNDQNCFNNVAADANGNAYIATNYTTQITIGTKTYTGQNILTAKYDANGNLKWSNTSTSSSTGTSPENGVTKLVSDGAGNLYMAGIFAANHGTLYFGASSLTDNTGQYEIFVTRFDTLGNFIWAKSPGGAFNAFTGPGLALDNAKNIYLTGSYNGSATFGSTTVTAIANGNTSDIFVAKLDTAANAVWAKTAGGLYTDVGNDVGVDGFGNVYITGYIGADGSPTAVTFDNITDTVQPNESYSIVAKIGVSAAPPVAQFSINNSCISTGTPVTFTDQSTGFPTSWQWNFTGGNPAVSNAQNPSVIYSMRGIYNVMLVVTNAGGNDTLIKTGYIIVYAKAVAGHITGPGAICQGDSIQLSDTGNTSEIQWQSSVDGIFFVNLTGDTLTSYNNHSLNRATFYRAIASGVCNSDTSSLRQVLVNPLPFPLISTPDSIICSNDSAQICTSNTFASYSWNTGDTTSCTTAMAAGGYWLTVTNTNGCSAVSNHQNISVYPVPSVSIVVEGDTLSSFGANSYQWYFNGDSIPGATRPLYIAKTTGNYAVQITDANGCTALSNSKYITITGLTEPGGNDLLKIYPNPCTDKFFIQFGQASGSIQDLVIYDELGRIVLNRKLDFSTSNPLQLNVSALLPGIYYVRIISTDTLSVHTIIKQ